MSCFWERNFVLTVALSTRDKAKKNIGKPLEARLQNAEGGTERGGGGGLHVMDSPIQGGVGILPVESLHATKARVKEAQSRYFELFCLSTK